MTFTLQNSNMDNQHPITAGQIYFIGPEPGDPPGSTSYLQITHVMLEEEVFYNAHIFINNQYRETYYDSMYSYDDFINGETPGPNIPVAILIADLNAPNIPGDPEHEANIKLIKLMIL